MHGFAMPNPACPPQIRIGTSPRRRILPVHWEPIRSRAAGENCDGRRAGSELCACRADITMAMVDSFLTNMCRACADFVYTVTRDFVRGCRTPILVLPDDVPAHPYAVAWETVRLASNAQVSLCPWKDTPDKIPSAARQICTFLRAHRPVAGALAMAAAASSAGSD